MSVSEDTVADILVSFDVMTYEVIIWVYQKLISGNGYLPLQLHFNDLCRQGLCYLYATGKMHTRNIPGMFAVR